MRTTSLITGIDHLRLAVQDLDVARTTWQTLGFTVAPLSHHIGGATANYTIAFSSGHLELIGLTGAGDDPPQALVKFLQDRGDGVLGLAFGAKDARAAHTALSKQGLSIDVSDVSRHQPLEDGTVLEPRFRRVRLAEAATPSLSAHISQHMTPELVHRKEWVKHPNGAKSIEGVSVIVREPRELIGAYETLFGPKSASSGLGRLDVTVNKQMIRFLSPDRMSKRYPDMVFPAGPPAVIVLTFLTGNLLETRTALLNRGVPLVPVQGTRLVVPPLVSSGVILEFAKG